MSNTIGKKSRVEATPNHYRTALGQAIEAVKKAVWGKDTSIHQAFATILAGGHLLIEDVPGVGKTTLATALAKVIGAGFGRIQLTSDLLPSDITGMVRPDCTGQLSFVPGPIMNQVVLLDELNRASPKTQSALLEVMAEGVVTVDGFRHKVPQPFVVIATQNPLEHHGVYPLPESQLDRFMLSLELGYPSVDVEARLLSEGSAIEGFLSEMASVLTPGMMVAMRCEVDRIFMDKDLAQYVVQIMEVTRNASEIALGCSTRAAMALAALARSSAWMDGRDYVAPDDVYGMLIPSLAHRIRLNGLGAQSLEDKQNILFRLIKTVRIPR
ncbi:MAG: MoxR family ATPase [Myxococcota bacterium]|nr:MoxR family ATPase [Myxococcota bacterium]